MVSKRYIRDEEIVGVELQKTRDSVKDVQSPTGTEKALTKDVAEQAADDALAAIAAANTAEILAKGAVTFSESNPTAGDAAGKPVGALWTVLSSNEIVSYWELKPLGWVQRPLSTTVIPQINIGTGTFGTLAGVRLAADAIDGMTITGALIRTAASGQRMQLDINGLRAFDSGNVQRALLAASSGGLLLSGTLTSYTGGNTQRAVLSNGALTFDYVGSPGAGTMTLGPDGITSTDADSRFKILKTSSAAGVGIDIIAGSGSYETGINIHPALKKISLSAESVEFQGGELSSDVSVDLASILSLASGTSIDGSSWLRKRSDGIVYGTLAFYRAAGFTSGATFATLAAGYRPIGGDQLPAVMWGAGAPGRAHFQMGGVTNGVLIVWTPPANTQYVSAKVSFLTL